MLGKLLPILLLLVLPLLVSAQRERVERTFKDTRAVNVHSPETLPNRKLDVRISHRFGDMFGDNGGWPTFYGLEQATDVAIGAEYGLTNDITVGFYRSKGSGTTPQGDTGLRQLLNGLVKYRMLAQTVDGSVPLTATFVATGSMSTSTKIEGSSDLVRSFPKFAHRMAYNLQVVIARKFGDRLGLEVIPGYTHRNLVPFAGENGIFSLGGAARFQATKRLGLIADVTFPVGSLQSRASGYYPALGVGFEIDTGGHVFQLNLTNAQGIVETDFIPYTTTNWLDGEFRMGFTISRWFNL